MTIYMDDTFVSKKSNFAFLERKKCPNELYIAFVLHTPKGLPSKNIPFNM